MSSSRMTAWTVWIVASIFYAYQYILRVTPNIMLDDIMQQFQIDAAAFGQFSGIYYIGYSLIHLPIGIMFDRFGPRKVMTACIILTVMGLLPLIFANHWIYPIAGRLLIGIGSSAAILGLFKIIRLTFNEERFPRMLSFSVTIGLIGAIYGGGPVGYMHQIFGYQVVVEFLTIGGLILALITYWIVPDIKTTQSSSILLGLKQIFKNHYVIWPCIFAGLMVGPLEGFADVWGRAFLKQVYGLDETLATSLPSAIFIGMCFGAPVLSFIAEKIGSYLLTVIGSGIIMALSFFSILFWHLTPGGLSLCFLLVGVCCAYQILAIYQISVYVPEQTAGLATAVANMVIMIFGYAFHATIGGIINIMGGTTHPQALVYGVSIIPLTLCVGTVGFTFFFIIEKLNKAKQQPIHI